MNIRRSPCLVKRGCMVFPIKVILCRIIIIFLLKVICRPRDFQALWGITDAMTRDFGWTDGVNNLYTTLAQDFVYKDPMREVIFFDNHDMARFYSVVGEDIININLLLHGCLRAGAFRKCIMVMKLGLTGFTHPNDGHVRQDFPGGWPSDPVNKFLASKAELLRRTVFGIIFKHLPTSEKLHLLLLQVR